MGNKKVTNNNIVHEFDPQLYPRKLWVMITDNSEDVYANFQNQEDNSLKFNDSIFNKYGAFCCRAERKSDLMLGVLIVFGSKKHMSYKTISHECYHAVEYFSEDIGLDMYGEHNAYLMGWMFECC